MDYKPRYFVTNDVCLDDPEYSELQVAVRQSIIHPSVIHYESEKMLKRALSKSYTIDTLMKLYKIELERYAHYHKHIFWKGIVNGYEENPSDSTILCEDFFNMPYHVFPQLPLAIVSRLITDTEYDIERDTFMLQILLKYSIPELEY